MSILWQALAASAAGKDLPRSNPRPNRMLRAQARDFAAPDRRDLKSGRREALYCDKTEVTTHNSFLTPHNPAPWNKPSETHGLREYNFCSSPHARVAGSKSPHLALGQTRLRNTSRLAAWSCSCALQLPRRRGICALRLRLRERLGRLPRGLGRLKGQLLK